LDGKWYQRGEMGWFGCVSDEKPQEDWSVEFQRLFDAIPAEKWISVVDCHI